MAVYFDASAFVKLTVPEPGAGDVRRLWSSRELIASSLVAYPEVVSALAAARRARRLTPARHRWASEAFDTVWQEVDVVGADEPLAFFAGALASRHGMRALDAVHLASALATAGTSTLMVSWDGDLRRAALAEGVDVFPA
jgi:hypothetical protein